jgi:hypothetical protein
MLVDIPNLVKIHTNCVKHWKPIPIKLVFQIPEQLLVSIIKLSPKQHGGLPFEANCMEDFT